MTNITESRRVVDERFASLNFNSLPLHGFQLPEVQSVDVANTAVPFAIVGNIENASNIVLESPPYLTPLDKKHYLLRLKLHQLALGDDYAVVGIQTFGQGSEGLTRKERKAVSRGDFSPLSARMLGVAESLNLKNEQAISIFGYSMGADTAIQTTYDTKSNANRGVIDIKSLGAVEAARTLSTNAAAKIQAMTGSGKEFFENVIATGSLASTEAWSIDLSRTERKQRKAFDGLVNKGVLKYMMDDVIDNAAVIRGFSTDASKVQLGIILRDTEIPVLVGRQEKSTVSGKKFTDDLGSEFGDRDNFTILIEQDDHSADDHLRKSAARIVMFAGLTH